MSAKEKKLKEVLACSECGKTPAKYNEFCGAYFCRECREKLKVEDYERVEQYNSKSF